MKLEEIKKFVAESFVACLKKLIKKTKLKKELFDSRFKLQQVNLIKLPV